MERGHYLQTLNFILVCWICNNQWDNVYCAVEQYTLKTSHNCDGNDRIVTDLYEPYLSYIYCEGICTRYEPCVGFVLEDKSEFFNCHIKYKCEPKPDTAKYKLYMKGQDVLYRPKQLSDSWLVHTNTSTIGNTLAEYESGGELDCIFLCLFHEGDCVGINQYHIDGEINKGLCILLTDHTELQPNPRMNTIWMGENPLQVFTNYLESFTKFASHTCSNKVAEHHLSTMTFLHAYVCAESCIHRLKCVGFVVNFDDSTCTLKRSCNPGSLESSAIQDTYIIKVKNMVKPNSVNYYTMFTDRLMTISEAHEECSSVGRHVVALETELEFKDFDIVSNLYTLLTTPTWTSLDQSSKSWQLDETECSDNVTVSWTLPWSNSHPIPHVKYGLLNQTSNEFISDDGTMKAYIVCEGNGPFNVYGTLGIDLDGKDEMTHLTGMRNDFVDCITVGDRNPVGAEYTFEIPTFTPDAHSLLVRITGYRQLGENKQHIHLMYAKSLTYASDGKNIQGASYEHCKWITENFWDNLARGKMFSTLQFYCECGQNCSKLYLKFFKEVLICDIFIP